MEIKITTKIEKHLYGDVNDQNQNIQKTVEILTGGSSSTFDQEIGYDQATDIKNNFSVRDAQTFEFVLEEGNTFNKDILTLINSPKDKLTFINMYAVETTGNSIIPARFKVSAEIGGVGGIVELGVMSSFSLANFLSIKFTKLFINDVKVPTDKSVLLVVNIGSSHKNV